MKRTLITIGGLIALLSTQAFTEDKKLIEKPLNEATYLRLDNANLRITLYQKAVDELRNQIKVDVDAACKEAGIDTVKEPGSCRVDLDQRKVIQVLMPPTVTQAPVSPVSDAPVAAPPPKTPAKQAAKK